MKVCLCPTKFLKRVPFVDHNLPCFNSHSVGGRENQGLCATKFSKLVSFVNHLPCFNSHSVLFILSTPYRDFVLILRQGEGVCVCVCVCVWGQRILGMEVFSWRNI